MKLSQSLFVIPCVAALTLTSCVIPGNPFDLVFPSVGASYGDPAPAAYSYYYGGRYYTGGRYENGNYYYRGRPYATRYYHQGRYYYGGRYERVGNRVYEQNRGYYNQNDYRQAPSSRYY